ncbi:MAG: hypothetical protein ABI970_21960 [Chloroflexota bacterium]|nr:hypothetical protein [Anaerolineae bacterium]
MNASPCSMLSPGMFKSAGSWLGSGFKPIRWEPRSLAKTLPYHVLHSPISCDCWAFLLTTPSWLTDADGLCR